MEYNPLISVIVPVYNVEKYIEACVDSLLVQTYPNLEIILIDDGSTDNSGIICEKYSNIDKRVNVYHKKNGGLSDARNFGISKANGEYLAFVDSDDWISPKMIDVLLNHAIQCAADITITGYLKEYKNKTLKIETKYHEYSQDDALKALLKGVDFQDHVWAMLFKSYLWDGIEFPVGKIYEDIRTTYKLFLRAKTVASIDGAYYHYRQRANSIVKSMFSEKRLEVRKATEELYSVPEFNNRVYIKIIDERIMRLNGFLSQEILLCTSNEVFTMYEYIVKETQKKYMKNAIRIIASSDFNKSLKVFAAYSRLGYSCLTYGYKKGFAHRYFKKSYETYE